MKALSLLLATLVSQSSFAFDEAPNGCKRLENTEWDAVLIREDNSTTHLKVHVDSITPDPQWVDSNGIIGKYTLIGYIAHENKKMELDPIESDCYQKNYAMDPMNRKKRDYAVSTINFKTKHGFIFSGKQQSPFTLEILSDIKAHFDGEIYQKPFYALGGQMIRVQT
jgi:hypothetical protein